MIKSSYGKDIDLKEDAISLPTWASRVAFGITGQERLSRDTSREGPPTAMSDLSLLYSKYLLLGFSFVLLLFL